MAEENRMTQLCKHCHKSQDHSKHMRYGNDIDNPVKHEFEPEQPALLEQAKREIRVIVQKLTHGKELPSCGDAAGNAHFVISELEKLAVAERARNKELWERLSEVAEIACALFEVIPAIRNSPNHKKVKAVRDEMKIANQKD